MEIERERGRERGRERERERDLLASILKQKTSRHLKLPLP